ncbi:MAG TPA: PilZ domain-containing protein [Terriglobales bacterium]|nr:PilZ domain-containing protein [Terriglobales bacterium]
MAKVVSPPISPPVPFLPRKIVARVLLAGLDDPSSAVLRDCFKQFNIKTVSSNGDAAKRLQKEKFEACVVHLGQSDAESVLDAARNSASNSRIVIYGISRDTQEALRFSRFGINAVINQPVERQTALKVVRSTHLLVVHELRRYVRLPVVTEVKVDCGANNFRANSVEISAGGLSLKTDMRMAKEQPVEVTFSLPPNGKVVVSRASVCWRREAANMIGIRFDPTDERRLQVKYWIDSYLEIG